MAVDVAVQTSERIDGPTPSGGAYAIAYFSDADGRPTSKAKAASIEVQEFDAAGNCLRRTYADSRPISPDVDDDWNVAE